LLAIAGVLTVVGVAAALLIPVIPEMLALGVALSLLGVAFALFGVGALAVAKAIEILAKVGKAGIDVIFVFFDGLLERLPKLAVVVARSILDMATVLLEGAIPLVKALGVLLGHIIDKLAELVPKLGVLIGKLIDEMAKLIIQKSPIIIEAGLTLLLNLLKGIKEHMKEIVEVAGEIIVQFLEGLTEKIPDIIDAGVDLLIAYIEAIGRNVGKLVDAGIEVVIKFLEGLIKDIHKVQAAGGDLVIAFIAGIAAQVGRIVDAMGDVVGEFLATIGRNVQKVVDAGANLVISFIAGIAGKVKQITDVAANIMIQFLAGLALDIAKVAAVGALLIVNLIKGISDNMSKVTNAAGDAVANFIKGIGNNMTKILNKGVDVLKKFLEGLGKNTRDIINACGDLILDILDAIEDAIRKYLPEIRKAGLRIALAILDGVSFGLAGKAAKFLGGIVGIFDDAKKKILKELDANSPSKVYQEIGEFMILGLVKAFEQDHSFVNTVGDFSDKTADAFQKALEQIPAQMKSMDEFNPTITPVLDLSELKKDSKAINTFFPVPNLEPSFNQAKQISALNQLNTTANAEPVPVQGNTEVNFNQTINAPKQLSTADIYRQTRNQIAMAKEELKIP